MSNVTVTMLQSGRTDDWGRPLVAGSSYSLDFDRARSLWQAGFASVPNAAIFNDGITPQEGGRIVYLRSAEFKQSLLASLVANSTASRSNGTVTITATGHGIPTGGTYSGFRFFYPGSANLAAGWYDSTLPVLTANTLSFTAPGPDFASESVNSAAAYTTATNLPSSIDVPAGLLSSGALARVSVQVASVNTAASKTLRLFLGASAITPANVGTTFNCSVKEWGLNYLDTGILVGSLIVQSNAGSGTITSLSFNPLVDNSILLQATVSAASDFLAILDVSMMVMIGY